MPWVGITGPPVGFPEGCGVIPVPGACAPEADAPEAVVRGAGARGGGARGAGGTGGADAPRAGAPRAGTPRAVAEPFRGPVVWGSVYLISLCSSSYPRLSFHGSSHTVIDPTKSRRGSGGLDDLSGFLVHQRMLSLFLTLMSADYPDMFCGLTHITVQIFQDCVAESVELAPGLRNVVFSPVVNHQLVALVGT